jgi:hypothetical protein
MPVKLGHAIPLSRCQIHEECSMNIRNIGLPIAFLGMLLGSVQASADCGAAHSRFKEGEVMCLSHHAARCGPMGAWTRLPERCGADNVVRRKPMPANPAAPDAATQPPGAVKPEGRP